MKIILGLLVVISGIQAVMGDIDRAQLSALFAILVILFIIAEDR